MKGDSSNVDDSEIGLPTGTPEKPQIPLESLRVFPTDADIPSDQLNTTIDKIFVSAIRPNLPEEGKYNTWKEHLIELLSEYCFRAWPDNPDKAPIHFDRNTGRHMTITEPGIRVYWREIHPDSQSEQEPWIVILNEGEKDDETPDWVKPIVGNKPVLLLSTRGVGPTTWTRKNPPNTIERSLALLGRTKDSCRVFDILAVMRKLKAEKGPRSFRITGRGAAAILAAYAAVFESSLTQVVAVNPPSSHRPTEGFVGGNPAILNVLRVLDIPDLFGLLAPRKLTILGGDEEVFNIPLVLKVILSYLRLWDLPR